MTTVAEQIIDSFPDWVQEDTWIPDVVLDWPIAGIVIFVIFLAFIYWLNDKDEKRLKSIDEDIDRNNVPQWRTLRLIHFELKEIKRLLVCLTFIVGVISIWLFFGRNKYVLHLQKLHTSNGCCHWRRMFRRNLTLCRCGSGRLFMFITHCTFNSTFPKNRNYRGL